jgi:hypothetical protein
MNITWSKKISLLMKIFGSKGKEVVECWRTLRNDGAHFLCYPQNIMRVIGSRRKKDGRDMWTS